MIVHTIGFEFLHNHIPLKSSVLFSDPVTRKSSGVGYSS
jgi:hypothetical protein